MSAGEPADRWCGACCSARNSGGCVKSRGITREAAGYSIRASESKISRMELGRVSFKARDVEDLLTLYGVTDEAERDALLSLAREANVAGWWHSYSRRAARAGSRPMWAWRARPPSSASTRCSSCTACCRPRRTPTRSSRRGMKGASRRRHRAARGAAPGAPEAPGLRARPRLPRRAGRGRAAPPVRRPRGDARSAPASDRDLRAARTSRCRSCRSASAATRARAARSRCSLPGVRPVGRRLSGAAHQCALSGQARGRRPSTRRR